MFEIDIRPDWTLRIRGGQPLPGHLIGLLGAVHEHGSLAAACRACGLSYRYAWGLLQQATSQLGAPLLVPTRGRGARLTGFGERLVWADRRIADRLSPMLESLAAEIGIELERTLADPAAPLRMHASHGFGVEALRRFLAEAGTPLDLKYRSPDDALAALRAGACDLAGLHLPIGPMQRELLDHYRGRLDPQRDRVVHLALRRQGIVLAPGNPKRVGALADLLRPDLRFIHRQPGSGTRLLLERLLAREGLDIARIHGCDVEELTHAAVAAYVASGLADAGFGLEPPARRYGLDFIPILSEHYFFLCDGDLLPRAPLAGLVEVLRSPAFRAELDRLPGYDASRCGDVQTLAEAFAVPARGAGP